MTKYSCDFKKTGELSKNRIVFEVVNTVDSVTLFYR